MYLGYRWFFGPFTSTFVHIFTADVHYLHVSPAPDTAADDQRIKSAFAISGADLLKDGNSCRKC